MSSSKWRLIGNPIRSLASSLLALLQSVDGVADVDVVVDAHVAVADAAAAAHPASADSAPPS